jgi:methylmalonyl-CoA mutase cobalamin-binding subunit
VVAASADIHECGLDLLVAVLEVLGCDVYNLGTSVTTDRIAAAAAESATDVVALSTYNGMALNVSRDLKQQLAERGISPQTYWADG